MDKKERITNPNMKERWNNIPNRVSEIEIDMVGRRCNPDSEQRKSNGQKYRLAIKCLEIDELMLC